MRWFSIFLFFTLFGSFNVLSGHNFERYDSSLYNSLPTVEQAALVLRANSNFKAFLSNAMAEIEKANAPLGFRLIHRHHDVPQPLGAVVERFVEDFEGQPAWLSEVKDNFVGAHPASWIVLNSQDGPELRIFEFSNDKQAQETLNILKQDLALLVQKLAQSILDNGLENTIALAVVGHSPSGLEGLTHLIELQRENVSICVPYSTLQSANNTIQTLWGPRKVDCRQAVACAPSAQGIHYSNLYHHVY